MIHRTRKILKIAPVRFARSAGTHPTCLIQPNSTTQPHAQKAVQFVRKVQAKPTQPTHAPPHPPACFAPTSAGGLLWRIPLCVVVFGIFVMRMTCHTGLSSAPVVGTVPVDRLGFSTAPRFKGAGPFSRFGGFGMEGILGYGAHINTRYSCFVGSVRVPRLGCSLRYRFPTMLPCAVCGNWPHLCLGHFFGSIHGMYQ